MLKTLRHRIVLPVIAFYLYLAGSAPFLGQWDSYDYLSQTVTHRLSALGFGRPVFLGYNILLWESMRRIFRLETLKVEAVVMSGTVLLGVLGVLLFRRLAGQFLSPAAARMAALAFAVSPMYAVYSGFIMTEVPMLVALIAAALILWKPGKRHPALSDITGGILFGMAVGIREQALTAGAAFLWILFNRPRAAVSRFRSVLLFGSSAGLAVLGPILWFYLSDPAGFIERTRIWLRAIPMGQIQFWNNVQSSVLYTAAICPAAWLTVAAAGAYVLFTGRSSGRGPSSPVISIRNPVLGAVCSIVLPVVVLWRDADVQIHPRYLLIALPGSLIFCASVYDRWIRSARGRVMWAVAHMVIFGAAIAALYPFRQLQASRMEFSRAVLERVPGEALLIAGSYSPILDYYRAIGVRPQWRILWSGWDWNSGKAEALICKAWAERVPVYLSEDPLGWRYFESEYLRLHYFLKDRKREPLLPHLSRIYRGRTELNLEYTTRYPQKPP